MGDTFKVVGQPEVGRCPGWRRHPWTSESDSSTITAWSCMRWRTCVRVTASVARPATNGLRASTRAVVSACAIAAGRRVTAPIALRPTSRPRSVRRAGSIRAGDRPSFSPGSPALDWPAVSTAGDLLARRGLVKKRRRRRPWQHPGVVPVVTTQPNDLWTADFKGHFRTRNAIYCYPLTVADQHTRYLLACHGLLSTKGHGVHPVFDRLFREYGLPHAIRTDNGVPFATTGIHGLSRLNVWWLRLGIQHQRILPAHPEQNGAHERMHKTLKGEACRPPQSCLLSQQRAFNAFRRLYNDEQPHEVLGDQPPAALYRPSERPYTGALPPVEYPGHFLVKRVTNAGTIRLKKRLLFLSNALQQHPVGGRRRHLV